MTVKLLRILILVGLLSITFITPAQDDACPILVQSALDIVGESCADLGRNQICYGHGNIDVLDFERVPLAEFAASGDRSDIAQVFSLATAPMDVAGDVWGVAVLALQADLPDTMPGQNVTFIVYGDTELVSEIGTSEMSAPMQAFRMTTGVGEPACEEAPRDGLLVQTPAQTTVHFLINGIEIAVGSTALLQIEDDTLGVNTFAGNVTITSAGETQSAAPGQRVDVAAGDTPTEPVAYDVDAVVGAPVDLLPDAVNIPPPDGTKFTVYACEAGGGERTVPSGVPLAIGLGWRDADRESLERFTAITVQSLQINGQPADLWGITGADVEGGYAQTWWWVISDPPPGDVYYVVGTYKVTQDWTDSDGEFTAAGIYPYTCTITVE
jgi:hypothetical protein